MDEAIKKIGDLKIAGQVIADFLQILGGDASDDNFALATITLNGDGFKISAHGADATIYYREGEEESFSYERTSRK